MGPEMSRTEAGKEVEGVDGKKMEDGERESSRAPRRLQRKTRREYASSPAISGFPNESGGCHANGIWSD